MNALSASLDLAPALVVLPGARCAVADAEGVKQVRPPTARDLLVRVGLKDRLDHYPVQLSGGEQQRVALARAFMVRPPILMADEPTGNLDSANGKQVLELLISLNREEGATLVLVTHDRELATHASRVIVLKDGLITSDTLTA